MCVDLGNWVTLLGQAMVGWVAPSRRVATKVQRKTYEILYTKSGLGVESVEGLSPLPQNLWIFLSGNEIFPHILTRLLKNSAPNRQSVVNSWQHTGGDIAPY